MGLRPGALGAYTHTQGHVDPRHAALIAATSVLPPTACHQRPATGAESASSVAYSNCLCCTFIVERRPLRYPRPR